MMRLVIALCCIVVAFAAEQKLARQTSAAVNGQRSAVAVANQRVAPGGLAGARMNGYGGYAGYRAGYPGVYGGINGRFTGMGVGGVGMPGYGMAFNPVSRILFSIVGNKNYRNLTCVLGCKKSRLRY